MPRTAYVTARDEQAQIIVELQRRVMALEKRHPPNVVAIFPQAAQPVTTVANTRTDCTGTLDFTFTPGRRFRIHCYARGIKCGTSTITGTLVLLDGTTLLSSNHFFAIPAVASPTASTNGQARADHTVFGVVPLVRYTQLKWAVTTSLATDVFVSNNEPANLVGAWIEDVGPG